MQDRYSPSLALLKSFGIGTTALLSLFSAAAAQNKEKPNIIILQSDDLGYADLNCYGGVAHTPNIDALAQGGVKLTNYYAPAPNSSPSRASLLTGRHPSRVGMYSYIPAWKDNPMHLKDEEVTIAELLKEQGYQTAQLGKWHISCLENKNSCEEPQPADQGFDYYFATENNAWPSHKNPVNFIRNGKAVDTMKGYASHLVVHEAKQWLTNRVEKSNPYFLYINFHEVHKKIASPPSLVKKYSTYLQNEILATQWSQEALPEKNHEFDSYDATYYANIENMDRAVGKLLNLLRRRRELQKTLILFVSDNGSYRQGSQPMLRGYKGEVFEGGIKVPAIFYWKNHFAGGKTVHKPAWGPDILPTICELSGTTPPKKAMDGTSILPLLKGQDFQRNKPLFWHFYRANPEAAMRVGDYSLVGYTCDSVPRTHYISQKDMKFIKNHSFKKFELYNLANDPGQQRNLADSLPQKLEEMKTLFRKTFRDIIKEGPYWKEMPEYNAREAKMKWKYERHRD